MKWVLPESTFYKKFTRGWRQGHIWGYFLYETMCIWVLIDLSFPHDQYCRAAYNVVHLFHSSSSTDCFHKYSLFVLVHLYFPYVSNLWWHGYMKAPALACLPVFIVLYKCLQFLGHFCWRNVTLALYKICIPKHPLSHSCLTFTILVWQSFFIGL